MNVVHVTTRYYPAIGGVEDYIRILLRAMHGRCRSAVITTALRNHHTTEMMDVSSYECVEGVPVWREPILPVTLKGYKFAPSLWHRVLKTQPDLIHAHSFMYTSADMACLAALVRRCPLVFNPYLADKDISFSGVYTEKTMGQLLMKADAIVVISDYDAS